ncbi:MAG: family N-acetyltransferase, partial [Massilia sp.]|nr:family N-acetyltransferase [Massilia sp.]
MRMNWQVVPASQFADHAGAWRALHAASAASPLLTVEFVASLLRIFGTGKEVLAWRGNGAGIDAMAVLAPARLGIWNTFQPAQAPVGIWLQRSSGTPTALLPGLLQALPFPALAIGLTQCDPMLMARPGERAGLRVLDYIDTARITMAGTPFDAYWASRGKNLRNNLKKQRRGLADDGVITRLEIVRTKAAMAGAIADFGRLESTGWKGSTGTAVHAENHQGRFYLSLFEA